MFTPERVLRDLERGRAVHAAWAPAAVAALVAEGRAEVRKGWARLGGLDDAAWRRLQARGARSWERARARQDAARAALPCTESHLVALLGLSVAGVRYTLRRIGAQRIGTVYEPDRLGRQRARPVWGAAMSCQRLQGAPGDT